MGYEGAPLPIDVLQGAKRLSADPMLVLCPSPGKAAAKTEVMLARLRVGGMFELLSPAAWARMLGYLPEELSGRYLRELMPLEKRAASDLLADLLDPHVDAPLDVPLLCKDEGRKYFRFHRRFDERAQTTFLVAEELD